jgi:hypothetical protein
MFDLDCPSGISFREHLQGLPMSILSLQEYAYSVTGLMPNVFVAGHMMMAYLSADEPITEELPPRGRVGVLFRQTEIFIADNKEFCINPGKGWLLFARYHHVGGRKIPGNPVGILTLSGYEEHPLEELARQAP